MTARLAYQVEEARWLADPAQSAMLVSGWIHQSDAAGVARIQLEAGGRVLGVAERLRRPDVQAHFGGDQRAEMAGFKVCAPMPYSVGTVELVVLDPAGNRTVVKVLETEDLPGRGPAISDYPSWAAEFDPDPPAPSTTGDEAVLFSVLMPVYNPPVSFLAAALKSIQQQYYRNWELCVVNDGSTSPEVTQTLRDFRDMEPRCRLVERRQNGGISRATNDALATARGQFVVMVDHDDLLRPHALHEIASHVRSHPGIDAVYSDEDKISADGCRIVPMLKPGFSPEFARGVMYVGHVLCVRTALARNIGGFDSAYDGIQDYEFFLRLSERTQLISHLPKILYHWRQSPSSSALDGNVKGDMDAKQAAAVQAQLARRGDNRRATSLGGHRVRLVSSIHPTIDVVSCEKKEPVAARLARAMESPNQAEVIILQEIGTQPQTERWIDELSALAALPDSGCVGPLLVSCDGRVYASGLNLGSDSATATMRGFDPAGDGYHGSLRCNREVSAVAPACVAIRRALLIDLHFGDESWLDFCLLISSRKLFHRICASVRMQVGASWHETSSIPRANLPHDEFYNPHFDSRYGDYRLLRR